MRCALTCVFSVYSNSIHLNKKEQWSLQVTCKNNNWLCSTEQNIEQAEKKHNLCLTASLCHNIAYCSSAFPAGTFLAVELYKHIEMCTSEEGPRMHATWGITKLHSSWQWRANKISLIDIASMTKDVRRDAPELSNNFNMSVLLYSPGIACERAVNNATTKTSWVDCIEAVLCVKVLHANFLKCT